MISDVLFFPFTSGADIYLFIYSEIVLLSSFICYAMGLMFPFSLEAVCNSKLLSVVIRILISLSSNVEILSSSVCDAQNSKHIQ